MDQRYVCAHCTPYKFLETIEGLNRHLNMCHGKLASYTCGQCNSTFLYKTSFIRHLRQQHERENRLEAGNDQQLQPVLVQQVQVHQMQVQQPQVDQVDAVVGNEIAEPVLPPRGLDLEETASMFLLNLRTSGNLTNTSVEMVVDNVTDMLKSVLLNVEGEIRHFLAECGVPPLDADTFLASDTFKSSNLFNKLHSAEEQLDYFCTKYGLVKPEELLLNTRVENRFDRQLRMFVPKQVREI